MKTVYALLTILILGGLIFFGMRVMKTQAPAEPMQEETQNSGRVMAPEDLTLKVGESGTALGGLMLTFNALVNDYRCPTDVVCIEAGAVNTNVTVATDAQTKTLNYSSDGVPMEFEGYKISIVGVSPNARSQTVIAPQDYIVTFHVESAFTGIVDTVPAGDVGSQCIAIGGTWDAAYAECLGITGNACQEIGGSFNECASACRHDPKAEVCTLQCVQVCEVPAGK